MLAILASIVLFLSLCFPCFFVSRVRSTTFMSHTLILGKFLYLLLALLLIYRTLYLFLFQLAPCKACEGILHLILKLDLVTATELPEQFVHVLLFYYQEFSESVLNSLPEVEISIAWNNLRAWWRTEMTRFVWWLLCQEMDRRTSIALHQGTKPSLSSLLVQVTSLVSSHSVFAYHASGSIRSRVWQQRF